MTTWIRLCGLIYKFVDGKSVGHWKETEAPVPLEEILLAEYTADISNTAFQLAYDQLFRDRL